MGGYRGGDSTGGRLATEELIKGRQENCIKENFLGMGKMSKVIKISEGMNDLGQGRVVQVQVI